MDFSIGSGKLYFIFLENFFIFLYFLTDEECSSNSDCPDVKQCNSGVCKCKPNFEGKLCNDGKEFLFLF